MVVLKTAAIVCHQAKFVQVVSVADHESQVVQVLLVHRNNQIKLIKI